MQVATSPEVEVVNRLISTARTLRSSRNKPELAAEAARWEKQFMDRLQEFNAAEVSQNLKRDQAAA